MKDVYYVIKSELLAENGAQDCMLLEERPNVPYVVVVRDMSAAAGRGTVGVYEKRKPLVEHCIYPPRGKEGEVDDRITVGLLAQARKTLLAR